MHRIGIDLGGTKTELIVTGDNPLEVIQKKRVETERTGYSALLGQLKGLVDSVRTLAVESPAVGLGAPGFVDPYNGSVGSSNLTPLCFKPFQQDLEEQLQMPVRVVNDANCFALSEALHGSGKGYGMVLGIILGTGMGGGLVLEGKIWSGSQGIAGEWGHATVDPKGPECYCGRRGCQELYLSGTGIQRLYRERSGRELGSLQIYEAWKQGEDVDAADTMEIFLEIFGQAIANLVMCLDPDVIVLGGGVSNLPILYEEGLKRVSQQVFQGRQKIRIVPNQLGDSSGVFGAAAAAGTKP